jgi:nitrate reductase cytochrome c-type subunit
MRAAVYHSKNASIGVQSASSANSRFYIKRPKNPADCSVSSKGSLDSKKPPIIPHTIQTVKLTIDDQKINSPPKPANQAVNLTFKLHTNKALFSPKQLKPAGIKKPSKNLSTGFI